MGRLYVVFCVSDNGKTLGKTLLANGENDADKRLNELIDENGDTGIRDSGKFDLEKDGRIYHIGLLEN